MHRLLQDNSARKHMRYPKRGIKAAGELQEHILSSLDILQYSKTNLIKNQPEFPSVQSPENDERNLRQYSSFLFLLPYLQSSVSATEQTAYKTVIFPFKSSPIPCPFPALDLRLAIPTPSLSDLRSEYQAFYHLAAQILSRSGMCTSWLPVMLQ